MADDFGAELRALVKKHRRALVSVSLVMRHGDDVPRLGQRSSITIESYDDGWQTLVSTETRLWPEDLDDDSDSAESDDDQLDLPAAPSRAALDGRGPSLALPARHHDHDPDVLRASLETRAAALALPAPRPPAEEVPCLVAPATTEAIRVAPAGPSEAEELDQARREALAAARRRRKAGESPEEVNALLNFQLNRLQPGGGVGSPTKPTPAPCSPGQEVLPLYRPATESRR